LLAAAERLMERDVQLVVLGSGEPHYEAALQALHDRYPSRVGIEYNFNDPLARLIYGGSDLFLMPSRFEPGGLGQMIAMRYGSLPLVHATGGLADTVIDAGRAPKHGSGFSFKPYSPQALIGAVDRALKVYAQPERWIDLQQRAMAADFSWSQSAEQYVALYRKAIAVHKQ
ncbi:MAG TPA: glycosyltransferase, partial [Anaerolineae bacterium]